MRWIGFLMLAGILQTAGVDVRSEYDQRFFRALRSVFDSFQKENLQRVFQRAPQLGCFELLGDWRTAAFFNEDNKIESWFYKTFEEVQADLSRYIFQGDCKTDSADVNVVSRFPVRDSMDAYNRREIDFDRIAYK